MNKFYQFIFLLFFSAPAFLYAGTTGKISGNVKDKRTNEPLTGATVVVDGTRLGGTTDAKGDYYILNVPPGTYSVTATFIGYARTTVTQVRIKIDQTTQVNLSMTETSFQTQDVAVVAERPKVEIDLTASKENISKEELSNTWGQGIADVVSDLTAANVNGGIRGSFGLDMSYRVEGMDLRDPGSNTNFSSVNLTAIQEVEVLTGGWNAEYGQANGSIVNIVTRKATDRIHAVASYRMRPSGKYHWGRNLYGDDDPMYNVMTTADFWDPSKTWKTPWMETPLAGYNGGIAPFTNMTPQQRADWWTKFVNDRNQFPWIDYTERTQWEQEVTVYGPVTKGLSFMLSGRYKEGVEIYPSALKYNPDMTFQGSIDWNMLDNTKVSLSGVFTKFTNSGSPRTNYQSSETNPSEIAVQQMAYIMDPYSDYKFWLSGTKGGSDTFTMRPPEKADLSSLQAKITHVFSNETFMEVALQQSKMNYSLDYRDIARAAYYPSFGLPLSELPDTTYKLPGYGIAPPNSWYTPRWGYAGDVWRTWTVSSSYGIKADLTSQVTKHHLLKTGLVFSYQMFEKHSHEGGLNPGNTFAQVNDIVPITDHPYEGALYVQDKIEVGNMVVNAGIRFDFFNANKNVSADIYDPLMLSALTPGNSGQIGRVGYRQDGSGPGYVKTTAKYAFSPRIGISHPITETTVLHFMFGMFNQRPSWNKLLANPVVWTSRFANNLNSDFFIPDTTLVTYRYYGQKVGNPALTWEKMIQYEIGFEQNIANVLSLDVTMYYKDGWDLTSLGMDQGPASTSIQSSGGNVDVRLYGDPYKPDDRTLGKNIGNFTTTVNGAWADVRGIEAKVGTRFDWINFDLAYTLSYLATGSYHLNKMYKSFDGKKLGEDTYQGASNTDDGGIGLDDAAWNPHNSAQLKVNINTPENLGPEFMGFYPLGDWSISTSTRWASGRLYTYYSPSYTGIKEPDNRTWADIWNTNLNLSRSIDLSAFKLKLYVQVTNLFNQKQLRLFSGTALTTYMEQGILPFQTTTKEPMEWSWYNNMPRMIIFGTNIEI